jgi:hypothetical protein
MCLTEKASWRVRDDRCLKPPTRHGRAFDPAIQAVVKSGAALVIALALDGRVKPGHDEQNEVVSGSRLCAVARPSSLRFAMARPG